MLLNGEPAINLVLTTVYTSPLFCINGAMDLNALKNSDAEESDSDFTVQTARLSDQLLATRKSASSLQIGDHP
jgi:hypothetical protein